MSWVIPNSLLFVFKHWPTYPYEVGSTPCSGNSSRTVKIDPYFEYVRSKANIADLPSREQMAYTKQILIEIGWR